MSIYQGYGNEVRAKIRVAVEIDIDGAQMSGEIFLNPNERIIDMMNDTREYVAFEREDGDFEVIRKSLIGRIRPSDQSQIRRAKPMPVMPGT